MNKVDDFGGEWVAFVAPQMKSTRADELFTRGVRQLESGEQMAARDTFKEVLRLDPEFVPAYAYLYRIHYERNEFEQAAKMLESLLKLWPDDTQTHLF